MGQLRTDQPRTAGATLASGALITLGFLLLPNAGEAVPAFARQFNVKCTTCHTPVPPRLNNIGIAFKRMGYRMPDADDQGNLILKDKPSRGVFDDFSLIVDSRAIGVKGQPTALELHEVETLGAGALGSRLSYAAELAWEAGEFELEFGEAQLLLGRPGRNFTARVGLLPMLLWEKFNHQRLTIARPLLLNRRVPAGKFVGFRLRDIQPGVELGFNVNRLGEAGALRSTYFALSVFNGLAQRDGVLNFAENNDSKDVMLQAMQLWGESNTIAVLWYHGKVTDIAPAATQNRIGRWSFLGNYRLKSGTDLVAGVGFGRDDSTETGVGKIKSRGWFAELDQAVGQKAVVVARYDRFEPNEALSARDMSGPMVSATYHALDNLLLTLEYQGLRTGTGARRRDITARVTLTY